MRLLNTARIGGVFRHPQFPSALASVRQRPLGGGAGAMEHRAGLPVAFQACPLQLAPPRTRIRPCPGLGGGGQGPIIVIEPGPSVGLCPSEPRTAVGALAPSPSNSAPGSSALEASSARSRRTGPRLLPWPYRLLRRRPAPFPLGEDSSLGDSSAAGDPNRDSCTSGTGACGSDCGATNDVYSVDTVAPEGCSYVGTRCDPNRPRRQVSLWEQGLSS